MAAIPSEARLRHGESGRRKGANRRAPDLGTGTIAVAAACVLAFLYTPIVCLMVFSFNSNPVTRLPLTGWTLDWYYKAFSNEQLLAALWNSLIVASAAIVICLAVGIPTALASIAMSFPARSSFAGSSSCPSPSLV